LRQRHQHAQSGAVDVAGLREIDQKLAAAAFELVQHFLLQLLTIANDELPFDVDYDYVILLLDREAHVFLSSRARRSAVASPAWSAVMAATLIMSSVLAPRERSLHGRRSPCTLGPM